MILTTKTTTQRIWLPIGHFPKIEESSDRKRRGIYGFLDIKTGQEYAFKADGLNSKETCAILDKLGKKFVGKKSCETFYTFYSIIEFSGCQVYFDGGPKLLDALDLA